MNGCIYLIKDNDQLVEMKEQPYDSEDLLQALLAKYPNLLAGDQMDSDAPRKWLLISREVPLPSEEEGDDRWAVDHLFLDQDAIPTLVEVKRSSDTRIRREVVGQMLDYAANAVVYWSIEEIRNLFEKNCKDQGKIPEELLTEFIGADADHEQFWQKTKTNLQAKNIRMVFVADEIPTELRRVVEFLNEQMNPAEVLAVEIKQYVGQGLKILVPRVIGQTVDAQQKKKGLGRVWDESSFFQELEGKGRTDEAEVAKDILKWSKINMPQIRWGKGRTLGSFTPLLAHKGIDHSLITVWTEGGISIRFDNMKYRPPYDDENKRLDLLGRLNKIPSVKISDKFIGSSPTIKYSILKDKAILKQFMEVLDWAVQEIKAS